MREDRLFGDGTWFAAIGDFTRERYLDFPYAQGTAGEVDYLARNLAISEGARVLDLACGVGRHAVHLARLRLRVVGADVSLGLLEAAKRLMQDAEAGWSPVRSDARQLPFKPASFDAAYSVCEGAFGLVGGDEEHLALLRCVAACTRPGGRFVLSVMNAFHFAAHDPAFDPLTNVCLDTTRVRGADGSMRTFQVPTRAFTPREVRTLLDQAGFDVLHVHGGTSGDYAERPLSWEDAEMLVVASRRDDVS